MHRALLQFGIRNFVFVTFSTISRLSRDLPIVTGGGNQSTCENHRLTPCHCQLSHMPQVGYEPGHWWETASGQWQRLRPYGHQNRPNIAVIYTLSNSVASRTLWYSVFVIYICQLHHVVLSIRYFLYLLVIYFIKIANPTKHLLSIYWYRFLSLERLCMWYCQMTASIWTICRIVASHDALQ